MFSWDDCENKLTVITSAFPFIPARLHLGNIGSTFLPADVYCRLLKAFGVKAVHVCATDVHSILAWDGEKIPQTNCDMYDEIYRDTFRILKIDFDEYIRTDEKNHVKLVQDAIGVLQDKGLMKTGYAEDQMCPHCAAGIPKRLVVNGKCPFCEETVQPVQNLHWLLRLEAGREHIEKDMRQYSQPEVIHSVRVAIAEKLSDWDFSRVNKFGIPIPGAGGLKTYIWFDSLIGYGSLCRNFEGQPKQFVHFFGKNIIYYHGVVWPVLLREALNDKTSTISLSARGFADLVKSDADLLDISVALKQYGSDFLRFYLCCKIGDNICDYVFSKDDLLTVVRSKLINRIWNLNYRSFYLLKKRTSIKLPMGNWEFNEITQYVVRIKGCLETQSIHSIITAVIEFADMCNRRIDQEKYRDCSEERNIAFYLCMNNFLYLAMKPFIPGIAEEMLFFDGWEPKNFLQIGQWPESGLRETMKKLHIDE